MTVIILVIMVIYVTMVYGPIAAFLVEMFPTKIRYTSMSLPYHIGNGWFGGMLPLLATAFVAALRRHLFRAVVSDRGGGDDVHCWPDFPARHENRRYRHRIRRADAKRRSLGQARAAAVPPPGIFPPETPRNSGAFFCGPEAAVSFDYFVPLDGVTKVRGARGGFVSRRSQRRASLPCGQISRRARKLRKAAAPAQSSANATAASATSQNGAAAAPPCRNPKILTSAASAPMPAP